MARLFLTSGQSFGTIGAGLATDIFGTSGNETVNVEANGDAVFDPSFNAGGDTINLGGNAASYTGSISGSNLVLTSAGGANIVIPFGTAGLTINFNDADGRVLRVSGGSLLLGSQTIAAGGVAIAAGTGGSGGGGSSGNTSMQAVDTDEPYLVGDYELTENTDTINGTSGGDTFRAGKAQISEIGGVSNSLSSADRIFGGGGLDHLFAVVVPEFFSGNGSLQVDVQPLIRSVERIEIEASDLAVSGHFVVNDRPSSTDTQVDVSQSPPNFVNQIIIVDAKDMRDIDHIGSFNSDGDLVIENLNTLTSGGVARNTEAVTITMDHTDNVNSDCDASDLHVYFDDDYLLAGQSTTTSQANYWLLDEDSADYVNVPLLNVERNGVRFSIDGNAQTIRVADSAADVPDSWELYAAALQQDINDQIAAGNTILVGLTVVVDYNNTDSTFNDFGQQVTIPAITILDAQGREFSALGFITPEDSTGAFDIYGRFDNDPSEQFDNPITVNIELNKVGRNGYGGDLIVGGKNGDKGIEVFNVKVEGVGDNDPSQDVAKPSNLGTLASNGGDLAEVYITTAPEFVDGDTFASLEIRDGFGDYYNGWDNPSVPGDTTPNDLRLVDADGFFGDLTLGSWNRVVNLDTLVARGGGDVAFYGEIDGDETNQPYSYTTGGGNDIVDLRLDGDGLDYAQSSVNVATGSGDDLVVVKTKLYSDDEPINQAILHNIVINTDAGNDTVVLDAGTRGNSIINTGTGNDTVYTDGGNGGYAAWAFNFDDANQPGLNTDEDLTGVQVSPMYLAGATVRVSLSGAGIFDPAGIIGDSSTISALNNGGGVMAVNNFGDADAIQADGYRNGYEAAVTIGTLISGRAYFGDQRDVNAAVLKAINEDAVLSKLLHAEIKENNTLVVYSLTSGDFEELDLEITVDQANWQSVQHGNGVVAEARALLGDSELNHEDVWGVDSATASAAAANAKPTYDGPIGPAEGQDLTSNTPSPTYDAELNAWYTGLGVDNAWQIWEGDQSNKETDNTINGGAGNDVIVLSTNSVGQNIPTMTVSTGNSLLNGASNETIVLEDFFGNDTVMNFETGNYDASVFVTGQVTFDDLYQNGLDFLNFLDYLTSKEDASDNTPPNGPDDAVSDNLIPVRLDYTTAANPLVDQLANEVSIVRLDTSTVSFAGLSETVVENLFNKHGTSTYDYGNLDDSQFFAADEYTAVGSPVFTDDLTNTAKGILMVENGGNLGEYKVFELDWNGNDTADANNSSSGLTGTDSSDGGVVNATLIGTLDFGTSLDGIHEINLVGSETYGALITSGWNGPAI